ncbi:MAG: TrkH family potassium uptake protein [Clostridia bacterium]|nr:TrkH family potassium uptake protein [Clostridia bacterium]
MNFKVVAYNLGQILKAVAFLMALPLLSAVIMGETSAQLLFAFIVPMLIGLALGFSLSSQKPEDSTFYAKEGFVIVGLSWILISLLGALPFTIGTFGNPYFADLSYVDWLFESVSGFTTTGSSILHLTPYGHQIDLMYSCGRSLLLWRSLTHWIGGMGVLIFILAVLPSSGASAIHLMQAESTGPTVGKLVSRMSSTARILYIIYAVMTVVQIGVLSISCAFDESMNFFHALVLSLGTAGTGGFAATSASVGEFGLYVRVVVTVFMFLFGINFNLYFCLLLGKVKDFFKNEELRLYVLILVGAILITTFNVWLSLGETVSEYKSFGETLGIASFTAVSLMTTSGFAVADFTLWPALSQGALLALMFVGASAGSTGGGFKCSRFLLLVKSAVVRVRKVLNPRAVYSVKMDGKKVSDEVITGVNGYFVVYALILILSTFVLLFDAGALGDTPLLSAFSTALSALNNIGPGMTTALGPSGDFYAYNIGMKLLLSLLMLFGRLEIYPILFLVSPRTYSRKG